MMNLGPITNPSIQIKPSIRLCEFIENTVKVDKDTPTPGIERLITGKEVNRSCKENLASVPYLLTDCDREFIDSLSLESNLKSTSTTKTKQVVNAENNKFLSLKDLHWLYNYMSGKKGVYFHELFEGSEVIIPENDRIPRSEALEKRCERYRNEFSNKEYHRMTEKFSFARNRFPEDTIAYQLKEMNKHIIAVLQFILSVVAGFAFGFMGIELMIGTLDFGFRLLLGIICALIIALAELYFLAKKLNEDVIFEDEYVRRVKSSKLD